MRISDWSSDVCSSDLDHPRAYPSAGGASTRNRRPPAAADRAGRLVRAGFGAAGVAAGVRAVVPGRAATLTPPAGASAHWWRTVTCAGAAVHALAGVVPGRGELVGFAGHRVGAGGAGDVEFERPAVVLVRKSTRLNSNH